MNSNLIKLSLIFLLLTSMVWSQPILLLEEAISIAMKQNYSVRIAKNNSNIAKNNASPGVAELYPRLTFFSSISSSEKDLTYVPYDSPVTIKSPNSNSNSSNNSFGANTVLFSGGKNFFTWEKLKKSSDIGEVQKQQAIESTLVAVIQTYYQITSLMDNLEISREALQISKQRLERAKTRADMGGALKLDVLNSEVDMNSDSVKVLKARLQLENAKRSLNFILGRPITSDFSVVSSVDFLPQKSMETWRSLAFDHNSLIKESRLIFDQSEYDVKIALASYSPVISGSANYEKSNTGSDAGFYQESISEGISSSLNLSIDLFTGFRKNKNLQNAKIRMKSSKEVLDQATASLETDLMNAFATYRNGRFTVEVEEQNLNTARVNFERTQELYQLGQVTTTQFREAQLNWITAEQRLINEKYTAKFAEVELYRLSGTLQEVFNIE